MFLRFPPRTAKELYTASSATDSLAELSQNPNRITKDQEKVRSSRRLDPIVAAAGDRRRVLFSTFRCSMHCRMSSDESAPSLLLALPDACLLAVLQCCAANSQRSLFSAARAHSRLHQAAVLALHSVTATVNTQPKANDALLYWASEASTSTV